MSGQYVPTADEVSRVGSWCFATLLLIVIASLCEKVSTQSVDHLVLLAQMSIACQDRWEGCNVFERRKEYFKRMQLKQISSLAGVENLVIVGSGPAGTAAI